MFFIVVAAVVGFIVPVLAFFYGAWVATKTQREKNCREALLSPREMCRKHSVQACHCCERLACCDNLSPGAELLRAARAVLVSGPLGGVTPQCATAVEQLSAAVKKLEEMG